LQVVLKATEFLHAGVQRVLTRVAEWRVPKIVCKTYRLYQGLVEP
jgi:hypothetical protein